MSLLLLIDGYNVYHAARKVCEAWAHMTPMTLCNLMAEDMRLLREGAIVVFDGNQPRGQSLKTQPPGYLKICFSGAKSDADAMLAALIAKNTAPRRLTVVSSDNTIRRAGRRRRTKLLKAQEYLEAMLKRSEAPPPRPTEPPEKRQGLAEGGDTDRWVSLVAARVLQKADRG